MPVRTANGNAQPRPTASGSSHAAASSTWRVSTEVKVAPGAATARAMASRPSSTVDAAAIAASTAIEMHRLRPAAGWLTRLASHRPATAPSASPAMNTATTRLKA